MDVSTFRRRFKELSSIEQDFLKILAVAYEPVNQTGMYNLLRDCGVRWENGNQVQAGQVNEIREILEETGWLALGEKNEMQVAPKYLELVMRMAVIDERFKKFVKVVQRESSYRGLSGLGPGSFMVCLREMRIALYEGNMNRFSDVLLETKRQYWDDWKRTDFFGGFFSPFDPDWLGTFPEEIQWMAVQNLIKGAIERLEPIDEFISFAASKKWKENNEQFISQITLHEILRGGPDEAAASMTREPIGAGEMARQGVSMFFKNMPGLAMSQLEESLRWYKKQNGIRNASLPGFPGILYVLLLLKSRGKDYIKTVHDLARDAKEHDNYRVLHYLSAVAFHVENQSAEAFEILKEQPSTPLEWLFYGVVCYWVDLQMLLPDIVKMQGLHEKAGANGYRWLEMELAFLLSKIDINDKRKEQYAESAARLQKDLGIESILGFIHRTEKWERSLDALLQLQPKRTRKNGNPEKLTRLVWWVDFGKHQIQPVEQTFGKSGWSKGRSVALKRLKEGGVDNLTEQDKQAAKAIKTYSQGNYGAVDYFFDHEKILPALTGHPLLFLVDNPTVSVELVEKKPQLLVEQTAGGYELKFNCDFKEPGVHLMKETPTRYLLVNVTEEQVSINRLLDFGQLEIPATAKEKLIEAVSNLSSIVTVQSEIGGEAMDIQTIEGDARPCLHLLPVGDSFKIEFFVKPFTHEPPYFKPGAGRENVITEINGVPVRAARDLKKEKGNARRVEDACPTLQKFPSENQEWLFEGLEDCLSVLLELEPLRESGEIVLEHPKGEKLRIAGQLDFGGLSLGIRKERDWFEMSGQVRVNENLVMDFRQLLELTQNAKSRFVELSDGNFLALTNQLRRKLEELGNVLSETKNELRFHPLAAHTFDDFTGLLHDLEVDAAWKKQVGRMQEARSLNPKVPSTFKASLRDYQAEGFRWLSQLAHWGVGACLADDMGLGKTIQALAVLVDRAKQGPALVVAPASVVRNWYHESQRFAPTLNPIIFGENDRQETLENLQPFDLLLCSYGLMQQETEILTACHFNTIVLDEAQAIKNRATKRSQAAMQLQAGFKVITTGTPIENHLGEIWNLFNFLNPGLLGSPDRFNERFATPIERFQDKERRAQLRKLLQPFILRRRKNDVLDELPEKTEVTLTVELSEEERSFYDALRRQAIENIERSNGDFTQKRFKILAELMRLRQACCHPRMVAPESELSSSKLSLFAETVEELLENGHKALVFSQFVKHLKIVEDWVQERGISYQYLDGSTPLQQRDRAIRAFQSGEGDLFLISLKAGGFGLNLTAADYVLHLDPWWNPAVEDQASDRSHRIGQQRPVTIYRLVTENTIEEKIVQLHSEKRDLADSLLEGTDVSGKLSAEELLELMKA